MSFLLVKKLPFKSSALCSEGATAVISSRISQSQEMPRVHLVQLTWKILGESESALVRGIQMQPKLFYNLESSIDPVLR